MARLIVILLFALAQAPAEACCGDGKEASGASKKAGEMIADAISNSESAIVAWLEKANITISSGFGRLNAEIAKQTAAMRAFEQGNAAVQAQMVMERARAEAAVKYRMSPRVCYEIAGGSSATVAAGEVKETLNDLNRDFAKRTLFTPNTMAAVGRIYDDHANKYCSQQDVDQGRCSRAADLRLQDADVRADTMLNSSSYTPEQIVAARAFVINVTNPMPTQNIPQKWEATPQGKTFVAGQYIEQARASVAANSLNAAVAARTPIQGLGSAAMLNKADVSELELMESQVRGRFESPAWYKMIANFSVENLFREANKMQALKLWLDLDSYKQRERMEAVVATQLSIAVKQDTDRRQQEARRIAGAKQ